MKVVLFCGGLGMRLRDGPEGGVPKPMVTIGYRPILWHVMKYYAHHGHKDFILCLGYKADVVKRYFLEYDECLSNDFVLSTGGKRVQLLHSDVQDWTITFADTGLNSNIGERLKAVERYLAGEETFLANYSDGVTDLPLDAYLRHFDQHGKIASFVGVRPNVNYHVIRSERDGTVTDIQDMNQSDFRINGGFFAFRREIFRYLGAGQELVHEPFRRLIGEKQLVTYPYDGFWMCMDTFKDKQRFDDLYASGRAPWEVWNAPGEEARATR